MYMKAILIIKCIGIGIAIAGLIYALTACNDGLTIKQDYDFSVITEKYRSEIGNGETTEFVFHLSREGEYNGTHYFVSAFIREGSGVIRDTQGNELKMNEPYPIYTPETFKLNYTSLCNENQKIELVFEDNFEYVKEIEIELQPKRE